MPRHEVYVGHVAALKGKTALVRDDEQSTTRMVLAQFDDMELVWQGNQMGYGWHPFYSYEFQEVEPRLI